MRRQKIDEAAHLQQAFQIVPERAVGDARPAGVHRGAAEFFGGHHLVGHRLHHVGASHEHVARVAHHEDEIGHRGRIDIPARARPHDHGNLRNHARGHDVSLEHLAIAAERGHAFLDARAAGIEQPNDGRARLHCHVLDFYDLLRVRLGERAAKHGKILGEDKNSAAVDRAPAGHHAVAGNFCIAHAELGRAVLDEHVELLERALVGEQLDALACGQFAAPVLRLDARLAAAGPRTGAPLIESRKNVLHGSPQERRRNRTSHEIQ